jgi:membrane-associated phospholipid phosphatase
LEAIRIEDFLPLVMGIVVFTAMFLPVPAFWHQRNRYDLRDAAMTVPWALLLMIFMPFPFLVGARLGLPLQDQFFTHVDHALHIDVAGIASWALHHRIGLLLNRSYSLLQPFIFAAIFIPALSGKPEARCFLMANVVALVIGLPFFILLPAIGPWAGLHLLPTTSQLFCQHDLLALRQPGTYRFVFDSNQGGVVCFPSFHTIWAILCAYAFSGFRVPLRVAATLLATVIVLSTITTGWHYFTDVLGGVVVACFSLYLARAIITPRT